MSYTSSIGNYNLNYTELTKPIQFPDGSVQTTASSDPIITTTITSSTSETNGWTFSIPTDLGNTLSYVVYSDNTANNISKTGLNIPMYYGNLVSNNTAFVGNGLGIYQSITGTSSTHSTFCSGFSQDYTISANGSGYYLSVTDYIGNTSLTWTISSNQVNQNVNNCPPTAIGSFYFTYTLTLGTPLPTACFVQLILTKIS